MTCRDGSEALEAARRHRPQVAVLDGLMPHVGGFEACRQIKAIDSRYRPKIVLLTAVYRGVRYGNEAWRNYGVDAYLRKPIDTAAMVRTVGGLLEWLRLHDPVQLWREDAPDLGNVRFVPNPEGSPSVHAS